MGNNRLNNEVVADPFGHRLLTMETHMGWPDAEVGSDEFIDGVVDMVKKQLKTCLGSCDCEHVIVPLEKFETQLNFIRFLIRICADDWMRRVGLVVMALDKKKPKRSAFGFGLNIQRPNWQRSRARHGYNSARIMTWTVPEYGEEVLNAVYEAMGELGDS